MTKNPITIQVGASIAELSTLMKENKLKKVPVLDGEKLVGIVTDKDVDRVSPSGATLLSVFEISALLAKTTVKDAMTKDVVTCTPDTYIEDAAILMRQNKINALVVVEDEKVVGIITESDMLSSLIAMLGGNTEGNQYIIETEDVPGVLNRVGGITHDMGINMNNFVFTQRTADGKAELLIKTSKDGRIKEVADAFRLAGFTVKQASVK
jgi:acetoin utilization protein AcuB